MKRLYIASLLGAMVVHLCMVEFAICSSNITDQMALLAFKYSIKLDPNNTLSNWTTDTNFCDWAGILCDRRRQRVASLALGNMGLQGTISPHVANLSFLIALDLRNNHLGGQIPDGIGRLRRLELLVLEQNMLVGAIPVALQQCRKLQVLVLDINNLTGGIPKELSTLPLLRLLYLGQNNLSGTIPSSFGNTSTLQGFAAEINNMHGSIPIEISELPNLKLINLGGNNLTGSIPSGFFNKSSMTYIGFEYNFLSGNLPSTGFSLPNIQIIWLQVNQLTGNLPSFFPNPSKLTTLNLAYNLFSAQIPRSLGNLTSLQYIDLSNCQITGGIPEEIGALTNLYYLKADNNHLTGQIPSTIRRIVGLQRLFFSGNNLQGAIPNEICFLRNLGEIHLEENDLSGSIPSCIGNLSILQVITINSNKLESIPSSLWNLQNLRILNLSINSLGGSLDLNVRVANVLETLDLSSNQISGNISSIVGSFNSLSSLNLSNNSFSGPIPNSLGKLVALDFLDLSNNNLSGPIPKSLEGLSNLQYLNLSYNKLSGEIPDGGPFASLTATSFMDNEALCGKPIFQVPPCASHSSQKPRGRKVLYRYILPGIALMVVIVFILLFWRNHHGNSAQSQQVNDLYAKMEHKMISYHELSRATDDFCEANLLGKGSYGSVYRGALSDGTIVAVKVLNLQLEGAFKSFDAECKVLRTTRHRNLVGVVTSCSNTELRALVLQYMSNGSLQKWLYSHNYCLNLLQRISIMIDVALALEYLHCGQSEPVVHCDLKPSNILLDEEMVACVADFGIAKILVEDKIETQTKTLGTLGYIAPEYGYAGRVSTSGDIYSYGIILLETFTRKTPTDEIFDGGVSLRQWVSRSIPNNVLEVVDSGLLTTLAEGDQIATTANLHAILKLGLDCSKELPTERGDIKDVLSKLKKIKEQLNRIQIV